MDRKPVVRLAHVKKSFGKNEVLKDISLDVMPGEVVAVIGPSGGGKSTLLRCATLLETFDSGELRYDDMAVARTGANGKAEYAKVRRAASREDEVRPGVSELQPVPALHGAQKHHGCARLRAEARQGRSGEASARAYREDGPGRKRRQGSLPAFGRPAAACEHRARVVHESREWCFSTSPQARSIPS